MPETETLRSRTTWETSNIEFDVRACVPDFYWTLSASLRRLTENIWKTRWRVGKLLLNLLVMRPVALSIKCTHSHSFTIIRWLWPERRRRPGRQKHVPNGVGGWLRNIGSCFLCAEIRNTHLFKEPMTAVSFWRENSYQSRMYFLSWVLLNRKPGPRDGQLLTIDFNVVTVGHDLFSKHDSCPWGMPP